jgi:hypothetical protein
MYEISAFMKHQSTGSKFPTCVGQVNYPIHKGQPNRRHLKFYFVGCIPGACYDVEGGHSHYYDTQDEAIHAAIAAGATRIQRTDCSFVDVATFSAEVSR